MANALVEFNDSQLGVVLGSVLHTLGAIAFLGGLVGYLAWHRGLARGHEHRRVLDTSAFLTYLAIVVNLLGGFMRTFQTGHPHLTQWSESPWVRAIAIKHVFLFLAQGVAVYLFEVLAPRLLKRHKEGTLTDPSPLGHRFGVFVVAFGIVLAAILGALTQVVPLVAADGGETMDGTDEPGPQTPLESVRYQNATGQLTSTPAQPTAATGTFDVPVGTRAVNATLLWTPGQYTLVLNLIPPGETGVPGPAAPPPAPITRTQGSQQVDLEDPLPGRWTYRISSGFAVDASWDLTVRIASSTGGASQLLADSRTIPPGQFFEINTEMENRTSLHWSWSASGTVHFDVHSHFDDEVQYHVEEDAGSGTGNFTNNRAGGYSLLWENTGTLPVTLDYRVWGDFTLDSVFPA